MAYRIYHEFESPLKPSLLFESSIGFKVLRHDFWHSDNTNSKERAMLRAIGWEGFKDYWLEFGWRLFVDLAKIRYHEEPPYTNPSWNTLLHKYEGLEETDFLKKYRSYYNYIELKGLIDSGISLTEEAKEDFETNPYKQEIDRWILSKTPASHQLQDLQKKTGLNPDQLSRIIAQLSNQGELHGK
jgi:hypothetical protein